MFLSPAPDAAVPHGSPRAPLDPPHGLRPPLVTGRGAQWKKLPYREMEGSKRQRSKALPGPQSRHWRGPQATVVQDGREERRRRAGSGGAGAGRWGTPSRAEPDGQWRPPRRSRMLPGMAPGPSPGGCPHPHTFPLTSQAALDTKLPLVLGRGLDEHRGGWASGSHGWSDQARARTAAEETASLGGDT